MSTFTKIERIISQENYRLAINILEAKIAEEPQRDLYHFLLGKCYLNIKNYQKAFEYLQRAAIINPYGTYASEVYSIVLNDLAVSGLVQTNRPKIAIETYDTDAVHPRSLYPIADCITLDKFNDNFKPDFYLIPNWLSPVHPVTEDLDNCPCPVVSMIVDRITYAEEHIKGNLIYSDIIIAMEDYAVEIYKKLGFSNVLYIPGAGSIGFDPGAYPRLNLEKIYDVVFLGNINSPVIYRQRNKILKRLDSLKSKYNILITSVSDYDSYWPLMNQAKIVLDATIDSNGLNYRMFQAMGIEALCFIEDDNSMVTELYKDKEDLVLYNIDNLDYLIDYYLTNDEERKRIAQQGYLKTINNYTHYHFLKKTVETLVNYQPVESQKKRFSPEKTLLYKGVVKHYQNKHQEAINYFSELEKSPETINNIMVQKIALYEDNNHVLESEIESFFTDNQDIPIINFNYISFLYHVKNLRTSYLIELIDRLLMLIEAKFEHQDHSGLYYIPEKEKALYSYFKLRHGEIIFNYNFETNEYYQGFLNILKEHCYRLKGLLYGEKYPELSYNAFKKCLELGSDHVWDYYETAKLDKIFGNITEYEKNISYCQEILPFEPMFKTSKNSP
jgi:tetratricopeptide (TPR) repeat protein